MQVHNLELPVPVETEYTASFGVVIEIDGQNTSGGQSGESIPEEPELQSVLVSQDILQELHAEDVEVEVQGIRDYGLVQNKEGFG